MVSFYKRGGKKTKGGTWYLQYFDEHGVRRTMRGCSDKGATEQLARKVEADVMLRKKGVIDAKDEKYALEGRRLLTKHIADWKADMEARSVTAKHVGLASNRVTRLMKSAGCEYYKDIAPENIQAALGKYRADGKSAKTLNDILASAKQFCYWMRANKRAQENPIDSMKAVNTKVDRRHDRRALTDDELIKLFDAAERGKTVQYVEGFERSLIYRFAALTGLRANEISTLRVYCFDFSEHPTVTVEAAFSKHRKKDTVPLPFEIIPRLQALIADKKSDDIAFRMPKKTVKALRYDLKAAGIEYETREGFADFHALRHTFISRLIRSGVNPKTVQTLARHHDAALTLNRYTHIQSIDQREAQEALPSLEMKPLATVAEATGTDDKACRQIVGTSVGTQASQPAILRHSLSSKVNKVKGGNPLKTKTLGNECHPLSPNVNLVRLEQETGFEPATFSLATRSSTS